MPFRSIAQRKYMWARHPEIAKRWTDKYGSKIVSSKKSKPCPGSKIRSKGQGRGLGIGKGKGPIGVPYRKKRNIAKEWKRGKA